MVAKSSWQSGTLVWIVSLISSITYFSRTREIPNTDPLFLSVGIPPFWLRILKQFSAGQGIILVYDVSNRVSFDRLEHWLVEVDTYCTKQDAKKILVGNKIDSPHREVSYEEGMNFARKNKMLFIEASAKTSEGVNLAFEELIEKVTYPQTKQQCPCF